jgi:hypothetical protein
MQLRVEVDRARAVRIDHLGRHALRQHVLRALEALRGGVRMDVDEAGCDVEPGGVDDRGGGPSCQAADPHDVPTEDADVGHEPRVTRAVDDGAATDDQVVGDRNGLGIEQHGHGHRSGQRQPASEVTKHGR